jgi:hypothetical protein
MNTYLTQTGRRIEIERRGAMLFAAGFTAASEAGMRKTLALRFGPETSLQAARRVCVWADRRANA